MDWRSQISKAAEVSAEDLKSRKDRDLAYKRSEKDKIKDHKKLHFKIRDYCVREIFTNLPANFKTMISVGNRKTKGGPGDNYLIFQVLRYDNSSIFNIFRRYNSAIFVRMDFDLHYPYGIDFYVNGNRSYTAIIVPSHERHKSFSMDKDVEKLLEYLPKVILHWVQTGYASLDV